MTHNHEARTEWKVWGCWTGLENSLSLNKTTVICVIMISCRGIIVVSPLSGRLQYVCVRLLSFSPSPPPPPFLWLTWGRFWSSSWTAATHCPAPPCAGPDTHQGIHPAGWHRWPLHLAHLEKSYFRSSNGCRPTGLSPFSHLSNEERGKSHRSVHSSATTLVNTPSEHVYMTCLR